MAKRKKIVSLALIALSTMALAGCNEVTSNSEGSIIEYTYEGASGSITTKDIIEKYLNNDRNSHASAFYDALYEIVVRASFEEGGELAEFKSTVESTAKQKIEHEKDEADSAGQTWEAYLNGKGYNDDDWSLEKKEEEYYLSLLYTEMTTTVDEQYVERFKDYKKGISETDEDYELQSKFNLLNGSEGYIQNYVPYHVKHILVQNDASQDYGYSRGHISSSDAEDIYKVVNSLANGEPFSEVANKFSEDPGNDDNGKKKGGEYIMATNAGFVNEFQLGIYLWDLFMDPNNGYDTTTELYKEKLKSLYIDEESKDSLTDYGVSFIPYGVIEKLNDVKDKTTADGLKVNNGDEDYYPRNIYFNKYFQNRNIGFITDESAYTTNDLIGKAHWEDGVEPTGAVYHTYRPDAISGKTIYSDIDNDGRYETSGETAGSLDESQKSHFVETSFKMKVEGVETIVKKNILCDTDGNPILVARNKESSSGIHFMIIERSGFDENDKNFKVNPAEGISEEYKTTLSEYYAPVIPKNINGINQDTMKPYWLESFPHVEEELDNGQKVYVPKKTYVQTASIGKNSFADDTVTNYTSRKNSLETSIKNAVNSYNKYYWLNDELNISLNDIYGNNIQSTVDTYIAKELKNTETTNAKDFDDKWVNYAAASEESIEQRQYVLLPEILAADFGNPDLYKAGNPGYDAQYHDISGNN